MGLQVQHASLCMWAFLVAGGWHGCAGWLLASITLLKTPNCVAQLQKQFSSFASKKDKAALDRGWAGVQWFRQWVTLIRCSTGRTTPVQMAWQKQSWTAASGGALGNRGHGGRGWGRCLPGKALRSQMTWEEACSRLWLACELGRNETRDWPLPCGPVGLMEPHVAGFVCLHVQI